jgi:hypothetical protein
MSSSNPKARAGGVAPGIEIDAPAETVWKFVHDFASWGRWNPLYIATSGTAEVGNTITFTVAVPGLKPAKGSAQVVAVEPGQLLEYGMSNLGGLVRATRYIEITPLGPERCRVVNGEIMTGLIGALLARLIGPKVGEGLAAMNAELKRLAEAERGAA